MAADLTALFDREGRSLVTRLRLFTPARWAAAAAEGGGTRGDVVHHLAQALMDAAAAVEGGCSRALPRLDSDLSLPDQLAVAVDDLVRAGPAASVAQEAAAHLLLHRAHLLGEAVPPGLAAALGVDDVVALAVRVCTYPPACAPAPTPPHGS